MKGLRDLDPIEIWLNRTSRNYSGSEGTRYEYRKTIQYFFDAVGTTAEEIRDAWYEAKRTGNMVDRDIFMDKLKALLEEYYSIMEKQGLARNSIVSRFISVKSFITKGLEIPLKWRIPRGKIKFHNRDITVEEIRDILKIANVRDRAYFCILAQSGIRGCTLSKLRYKHIKEDFEKGIIPCRIVVPEDIAKGAYGDYYTFIGEDSMEFLKAYLLTREPLNDDSLLFVSEKSNLPEGRTDPHSMTVLFSKYARKVGLISKEDLEKYKGKPKPIRMYCLRKWFRNQSSPAGNEFVQFWMGHKLKNQDEHYLSKENIEKHRRLYEEKALPNLRIFPKKESEVVKILEHKLKEANRRIEELEKQNKRIEELERIVSKHIKRYTIHDTETNEFRQIFP